MGTVYEDEDQMSAILHAVGEYFEVKKKMDAIKAFTLSHPIVTLFSIVLVAMCSIPIVCFFTFIFGSICLAVTGFVLIEGTVLTIATVFFGISLLIVGFCAVGISGIIVAGFYVFDCSCSLIQKVSDRNMGEDNKLEPRTLKAEELRKIK
ncbi:hypothetical protein SNE40_020254 [Patella caerulea]